ncbi:hypothetical protein YC2023_076684 [Brassica napus]
MLLNLIISPTSQSLMILGHFTEESKLDINIGVHMRRYHLPLLIRTILAFNLAFASFEAFIEMIKPQLI